MNYNPETKASTTFIDANVQCTQGYTGNLCASCATNFVRQGEDCKYCKGGADTGLAFAGLILLCLFIFVVMLVILSQFHKIQNHQTASRYFGQLKITIMFLQLVSAMPVSLDSVRWPDSFRFLAINLYFVNFEFLQLFDLSSCSLSVHPLNRFAVHICFVPFLLMTSLAAYKVSLLIYQRAPSSIQNALGRSKLRRVRLVRRGMTFKMCLTLFILLYPGLGTRIFGVLRCSKIQGLEDLQWFQQDLSLECYTSEGQHAQYLQAAVWAICLIVLGFPMLIGVMLWRNRKHLHDTSTSQHQHVKFTLGSVYVMYEKEYWWFEIIVMITKQIMTGALGVLKPGTRKC